ncbi:MAG TPA: tRNA uridine-5-carboxymethylaminomethyl(34) synthesis GTPase MnmE [Thermoanaerobaculia bacterium]|nr:tRNA uridine-5-carboxymethylaminomethyl(34) synthesis GTPase MnmE [Thermoanaerobaculia bacterium]
MIDTIVAPATPIGRSALAIVRIDGPLSGSILQKLSGVLPEPRHVTLVRLAQDGQHIDQSVAVRYEAPYSFTGNDLVELTLHGSAVIVEDVIRAAVALGARQAEAGEFTERAVLNGKLDLVQAESIADLINARTSLQASLSLANLEGSLSRKATAIRESLLHVISRLEAALDFSEEGYEFISGGEARAIIEGAIVDADALLDTYRRGRATRAGLNLAILGRPNAGKSTLLNRLVGSDRAIVTPIPGTTRDIVRETIEIGGLPVTIADTAGLRESGDVVESIGIERARKAAESSDIILYLVDAAAGLTDDDRRELERWKDAWLVYAKTDLAPPPPDAMTSEIGELLAKLDKAVREQFAAPEGSLVNERQRQAVAECADALRAALVSLEAGHEEQIVLVDLYRASTALGLLIGAITREDLFSEIFSKFCIGK